MPYTHAVRANWERGLLLHEKKNAEYHMVAHNHLNSKIRGSRTLFWPLKVPGTRMVPNVKQNTHGNKFLNVTIKAFVIFYILKYPNI